MRDVRRNGGGRGLSGGPGKRVDGVFPGRPLSASTPTSGRLQPRTRGGTFHGKMDRCRKNQGWTTTACSGMPERDGKNQGDKSPKQAGSCWFARPC